MSPNATYHDSSAEDAAPIDDLGGSAEEVVDAPDPDTSLEALEALDAAESRFADMVESVSLPPVQWSTDADHPDYAHAHHRAIETLDLQTDVKITFQVYDLLIKANRFEPEGTNNLVCLGLRGAALVGADAQETKDSFVIRDVRPDHEAFHCTLGFVDTSQGKLSAYRGSTVPNKKWMRNYYKLQNNIPTANSTRCNMLPTGCYYFRVNAHGSGRIKPALRMTNPNDLTGDATCTVLRTSKDLAYAHDDLWDVSMPYDNIHCAYSETSFSSAGCQTVKGANKSGAWGKFQDVIGALGWNQRIDYVLLTGREVAIAAAIIAAGRQDDAAFVDACLGRLRVGSRGPEVLALQKKLGFNGTSYFGPLTKKRLTERESSHSLNTDGVYALADDAVTGWGVFPTLGQPFQAATDVRLSDDSVVVGQADSREGEVVFRAEAGAGALEVASGFTLVHHGQDIPLRLTARIEGIPASGPAVEIVLRTIASTGSPTDEALQPLALRAENFDRFAPNARIDYRDIMVSDVGATILRDHGITANPRRLAHFMAQMHHECGGFRLREENLSYSAKRLTEVWSRRFPTLTVARQFANDPEKLANLVYGGRLGNTQPGDGYRYRGRGMIQLTGRDNYRAFSNHLNVDLEGNPDLAFDATVTLQIAAHYWSKRKLKGERGMNALADDDKLRAITYRINGGFNGFTHRQAALDDAKDIWGDIRSATTSGIVDRGDFGDNVRRLQLLLIEQGVLGGRVDGKFGKGTYDGLLRFKSKHRMSGVGYADVATFAKLKSANPENMTESANALPHIGQDPEPIRPEAAYTSSLTDDADDTLS